MPAAQQLLKDPDQSDTSVARWTEYKWSMEGRENTSKLHTFVKDVCPTPPGITFSRPAWVKLNRLQTGVGLFHSETHKWIMTSTAACESGAKEQTAEHVITFYTIYHHPMEPVLSQMLPRAW